MTRAQRHQQVEAGQRRRAGAGGDDLGRLDRLAGEGERVGDGGRDDDRGAVLVVVEHRDLHALAQQALDLEALRRLDVLEVDAAEGRLERRDDLDQLLRIAAVDLDVEDVDAGELLEEDRLAFHDGLGGERPDVAEAEHGGAVGEHRDEVLADGEAVGFRGVGGNGEAGGGDARRIGEREVALRGEGLGRLDLELSGARHAVVGERGRREVGGDRIGHQAPWTVAEGVT